jgi:hypothetical protein
MPARSAKAQRRPADPAGVIGVGPALRGHLIAATASAIALTAPRSTVSPSIMRSSKSRKTSLRAMAVVIALGGALAGGTALRDVPLLEAGHSALRQVRSAAARPAGPPLRRWVAGSGQSATEIWLYDPVGLVEDALGNLYFADAGEGEVMGVAVGHFIWRIAPDHTALVIAGTGLEGRRRSGSRGRSRRPRGPGAGRSGSPLFRRPAIPRSCGSRRMAG